MAVISIVTRNQNGNALTSIGGIPFVAILQIGEQVIGEQTVELILARTIFDNLSPGSYTAKVRHELVEPPIAQFDVTLMTEEEILERTPSKSSILDGDSCATQHLSYAAFPELLAFRSVPWELLP
ncbi:MAG: hypothetical protein HC847_27975, partial [Hydrococcus sp. RU_2_2]|nr:hypothetical protein [Hydrococcus sp. RU_2_2]